MPLVRKPLPTSLPAPQILFALVEVQGRDSQWVAYGIINEEFTYVSPFKVLSRLPWVTLTGVPGGDGWRGHRWDGWPSSSFLWWKPGPLSKQAFLSLNCIF